jgi:ABC-type lipoprotein export system ATPase subunit
VSPVENAVSLGVPDPALSIRALKFRYGAADTADAAPAWTIDIPALDLARGERLLLTGSSGRGKSTLLYLIAGVLHLAPPSTGEIRVAGRDIHALRGAARDTFRGRHVGMIFQTFHLLTGFSAVENVMAAMMFSDVPSREHRPRALELLSRLGITAPDRDPDRLSVGQQQRVAVARALACRPDLVLADEPTASLDPENSAAAVELIQAVCQEQNAALLCVSHDPSLAPRFERRVSLDQLAGGGNA